MQNNQAFIFIVIKMARPSNAPMEKSLMKISKEWLARLLADELRTTKKLREENELLKQCLDKLMLDADVLNVKVHWELWDYVYVRSDKQFKLNVKD